MTQFPSDLKYTKDHEWARIGAGTVTVGITAHAQSALGDIVYVDLPKAGRVLKRGETFGVVESIKAVSDLYSPVSGKVVEANSALTNDPALINRDPHGGAWLVKIEITGALPSELPELMDARAYSDYVSSLSS